MKRHKRILVLVVLLGVTGLSSSAIQRPDYDDTPNPEFLNPSWMAVLPDDQPLSEVTMPGSHNTMALYGGMYAECQRWSLASQLRAGVRFLDIRVCHVMGNLTIHHGVAYQRAHFGQVLEGVTDFLREYPTETVLMRIREEFSETGDIYGAVVDFIHRYAHWDLLWHSRLVPTMGEARGKLIILQDFPGPDLGMRYRSLDIADAWKHTVVVERWWQVPLSKVGRPPRLHPRRHRIYKLVEDSKHLPTEKMALILTQTVPKLGGRGDTVFVKKSVGRNKLLPPGLAVYPSIENKQMFAEEMRLLREGKSEERVQTRTGQLTVDFLKNTKLIINQMPSEDFQVTKEVVCRCFLKKFRLVVPLHALKLQQEPIKELGDYWCEVTVNGIDTVRVPVAIVPYEDPSASYQKQLRAQRQQQAVDTDTDNEDDAAVKAVTLDSDKDSVSEASTSMEASEATTAPPSDSPKKE